MVAMLKRHMEEKKLDQVQFAKILGISSPLLSQILNGKRNGHEQIWNFAKRLRISVCELLGLHDAKTLLMIRHFEQMTERQKSACLEYCSIISTSIPSSFVPADK